MSYFAGTQDVYATLGALFSETCRSRGLGGRFARAKTDFQLDLSDPAARISIRGDGEWVRAELGGPPTSSGVVAECSADTAHEIALGKTSLAAAVADDELRLTGPIAPLADAWTAFAFAAPDQYAAILKRAGREELIVS